MADGCYRGIKGYFCCFWMGTVNIVNLPPVLFRFELLYSLLV